MATKYDVFEVIYTQRMPVRPIEVLKKLNKNDNEYNNVHRLLAELEKSSFAIKTNYGFQAKRTDKTALLHNIIQYCLRNSINYNLLLDKSLAEFISASIQKEITSKDAKINPRTLKKYIQILNKYGLLLVISQKPLRVRILYNKLLNEILVYFNLKHTAKEVAANYMPLIGKELALHRKLRKKNEAGFQRIVDELEVSFVYHSLALEGNPVTLPDTIKILKDKIIPSNLRSEDVDEIKNYQTAILQMLKDSSQRKPLTLETILYYHKLAMSHRPDIAGKIRKVEVRIKGNPDFKIEKAENIKPKLEQMLEKYNMLIKQKNSLEEILSFSAFFHNEFQHIHPFVDGNSRTTRLITFHLLQANGIPILDVPFGLMDEYMKYTKGSRQRNDQNLSNSLQKIILFNLKKINETLRY